MKKYKINNFFPDRLYQKKLVIAIIEHSNEYDRAYKELEITNGSELIYRLNLKTHEKCDNPLEYVFKSIVPILESYGRVLGYTSENWLVMSHKSNDEIVRKFKDYYSAKYSIIYSMHSLHEDTILILPIPKNPDHLVVEINTTN